MLFVCLLQVVYKVDFFLDSAFIVTTTGSSVFDTMNLLPRLMSVHLICIRWDWFVSSSKHPLESSWKSIGLIYLTYCYHIFLTSPPQGLYGQFWSLLVRLFPLLQFFLRFTHLILFVLNIYSPHVLIRWVQVLLVCIRCDEIRPPTVILVLSSSGYRLHQSQVLFASPPHQYNSQLALLSKLLNTFRSDDS